MKYIEFTCRTLDGVSTLFYSKYKAKTNGADEVLISRPLALFNSETIGHYIADMLNNGRNVIDSMELLDRNINK